MTKRPIYNFEIKLHQSTTLKKVLLDLSIYELKTKSYRKTEEKHQNYHYETIRIHL